MRRFLPLLAVLLIGGCGRNPLADLFNPGAPGSSVKPPTPSDYHALSVVALVCIIVGVGTLIVSSVVPLVPRRASVMALLCAVGCYALQMFLDRYLWLVVLASVLGGIAVAAPWVIAWVRAMLHREGKALAKKHPREGAALMIAAKPAAFKSKTSRKWLAERLSTPRGGGHAGPGPT
jgi:MFS family permease